MESELASYTCYVCSATVHFFPGFAMTCKSKPGRPVHDFAPSPKLAPEHEEWCHVTTQCTEPDHCTC